MGFSVVFGSRPTFDELQGANAYFWCSVYIFISAGNTKTSYTSPEKKNNHFVGYMCVVKPAVTGVIEG